MKNDDVDDEFFVCNNNRPQEMYNTAVLSASTATRCVCVTHFEISPNSIYQQQELHVLVTASLFIVLTITYKYQSPISNDIKILSVVYVFIL